jgi:hypothetical protein
MIRGAIIVLGGVLFLLGSRLREAESEGED